jgi:PPOX class probable FMN-dependent enzyme
MRGEHGTSQGGPTAFTHSASELAGSAGEFVDRGTELVGGGMEFVGRGMELVGDEAGLRALVGGEPGRLSLAKQRDRLDEHARAFLARSPFCVLATSGADGSCDATPRGDEPGFARVLDDRTLAIPERPGNKRLDSLRNVLANPRVGLLFLVPGVTHTLRVNGSARLVAKADFFEDLAVYGKPPVLAVLVTVAECYFHCSKAFVRAKLWQPEEWSEPGSVASLGTVMRDQVGLDESQAIGVDQRGSVAHRADMF